SSISFRNAPLPPTFSSRRSSTRSPVVVITVMLASRPSAASRAFTCSACQRARALPREPMRIILESEKLAHEAHQLGAVAVAGDLLDLHRRRVEQLVDDRGGGGLDRLLLLRGQGAEAFAGLVQLFPADAIGPLAQLHQQRHQVQGLLPGNELPHL